MQRALVILVLTACDAGVPATSPPPSPSPPIARPIDAHIIEMDVRTDMIDVVADVADVVAASMFVPIAARPTGWERLATANHVPELEFGRAGGTYTLIANRGGKLYTTTIPTNGDVAVLNFTGQTDHDRSAALLMFAELHDGGKHVIAVPCGIGRSGRWSCIAPVELSDAELHDDLVFKLGATVSTFELPPIGTGRPRRYQITFP